MSFCASVSQPDIDLPRKQSVNACLPAGVATRQVLSDLLFSSLPSFLSPSFLSFIHPLFIEHLPRVRPCSEYWGDGHEEDGDLSPHGAHIPSGVLDCEHNK